MPPVRPPFEVLVEHSLAGIYLLDDERIVYANPQLARMLGHDPAALLALPSVLALVHPDDRAHVQEMLRRRAAGEVHEVRYFWRGITASGDVRHFETLSWRTLVEGRPTTGGTIVDVTERRQDEQELADRESRLRLLLDTTPDLVFTCDASGLITSMNPAGERLAGLAPGTAVGRSVLSLTDATHAQPIEALFAEAMAGRDGRSELPIGPQGTVELRLRVVRRDNRPVELMGVGRDITAYKQKEAALRSLTLEDELTGLYNRRGFLTLAERHLKVAVRRKVELLLLFCDLDGLKPINDTYGHAAGDRALIAAADLLRRTFRSADIIARLGGDEFTVFPLEASGTSSQRLAERLAFTVDAYNDASGEPFRLSFSIGVARFDPDSSLTIEQLLAEADHQLYEGRRRSRG